MTPPPHTMQLAGRADRALTIAIHDALRRGLERHCGRTEAPRDLGSGTLAEIYADCVDWHQIARLAQHGCPRSSPCASSADAGCEDPAR